MQPNVLHMRKSQYTKAAGLSLFAEKGITGLYYFSGKLFGVFGNRTDVGGAKIGSVATPLFLSRSLSLSLLVNRRLRYYRYSSDRSIGRVKLRGLYFSAQRTRVFYLYRLDDQSSKEISVEKSSFFKDN